jgi:hypothetical protein
MKANDMINFGNITLLTPVDDIKRFFDKSYERKVFSELAVRFICIFSESILKLPNVKNSPDLVALAFWMRKSNIKRLEKDFISKCQGQLKVPVGKVIHFAPSNVDTIFIYSLFISLMVGNTNVVRVSSKSSFQKDVLVDLLKELLLQSEFRKLQTSLSIVTYPHSESITSFLCSKVDMRVIWGGDETVNQISSLPLPPTATEIKFANKYSLSLLNAKYISELAPSQFVKFVNDFVNDSYWFGQQGCSSPRTVIWLNQSEYSYIVDTFWEAVAIKSSTMFGDEIVAADVMNKIVAANLYAVSLDECQVIKTGNMLTRINLSDLQKHNELRNLHCGSGFFLENNIDSLESLKDIVDRKSQTISYFGFDVELLKAEFIEHGIFPDRVVPVGEALNFSIIWDGYDLFQCMTRTVNFV